MSEVANLIIVFVRDKASFARESRRSVGQPPVHGGVARTVLSTRADGSAAPPGAGTTAAGTVVISRDVDIVVEDP